MVDQRIGRQHLVFIEHESLQQMALQRSQARPRLAPGRNFAATGLQDQRTGTELVRDGTADASSAQDRVDAGHQLARAERLTI